MPRKKKKKVLSNPYLFFGVETENFFKIQRYLLLLFMAMTALSLIQMVIFGSFDSLLPGMQGDVNLVTFASLG